jgi:hypothetical protein
MERRTFDDLAKLDFNWNLLLVACPTAEDCAKNDPQPDVATSMRKAHSDLALWMLETETEGCCVCGNHPVRVFAWEPCPWVAFSYHVRSGGRGTICNLVGVCDDCQRDPRVGWLVSRAEYEREGFCADEIYDQIVEIRRVVTWPLDFITLDPRCGAARVAELLADQPTTATDNRPDSSW